MVRSALRCCVTAIGCGQDLAEQFAPHLSDACELHDIKGPVRLAAFLAQIAHESGALRHTRELWGPTPAQARYEGRKDLGNTHLGDGFLYRGRGLLQVTGRAGYAGASQRLGVDLLAAPELLEQPRWAALSAADWWAAHGCNALADAGDFTALTRRINGGTNGLEDRLQRWARAKEALAGRQKSRRRRRRRNPHRPCQSQPRPHHGRMPSRTPRSRHRSPLRPPVRRSRCRA
ncbi:MAG: glycoside hydrolase family 19 protein [Rhizobiales bacterium]|nr:glycoside hydrolase family 19 protein [Hyphomicrobiales bacterium]